MVKIILSQARRWAKLLADPTCRKCGETKTPADFPRRAVDYSCNECRRIEAGDAYRAKVASLPPRALAEFRTKVNTRQNGRRAKRIAAMTPDEEATWRAGINSGNTARRYKVRDDVYKAYGGYVCACCGEVEPAFLTIDHMNNDGAAHKREFQLHTGEQMHRWLARNGFPAGFQVLCMNCNWGKRNNYGVCPHQGKVQRSSREGVGSSDPKRSAPWSKKRPRVMI
jgi:hypothetical protein